MPHFSIESAAICDEQREIDRKIVRSVRKIVRFGEFMVLSLFSHEAGWSNGCGREIEMGLAPSAGSLSHLNEGCPSKKILAL
jgi:hypothetical protein